jgi:hypothetical protein
MFGDMTRHLTWLATVGVAGLAVLAGCGGSSPPAAQVASVAATDNGTTTTTAAGATSEADAQQAMLDFAACMREHGVDMPDPTFNDGGGGQFIAGTAGGPEDKTKVDAAQAACQSFLDKVKSNAAPMDPAKMEEEKQKLLAFAQCMRDHGIDFPDPQISSDGGGLQVQMGGPGMDASAPGFKDANDACAAQVGMSQPGAGNSGGIGVQTAGPDGSTDGSTP